MVEMIFKIKYIGVRIPILLFLLTAIISTGISQESIRSRLSSGVTQKTDGTVNVNTKLRARIDKIYKSIPNVNVSFYAITDTSDLLLGKAKTDAEGVASIVLDDLSILPVDEEGYFNVSITYDGDDTYRGSDSEVLFKPAKLDMVMEVVDSIKTVTITAMETGEEESPIVDQELILQVPRMFSNLTIASEYTDDDGYVEFKFPDDLPGDQEGKLNAIARIIDSDDYGTIETEEVIDWGVPVVHTEHGPLRELWSPNAPLWMVITFAILMIVTWGHFIYIVIRLALLKNEGIVEPT